jgi:hypothetical protein
VLPRLVDNWDVDHERAETHLRRVAESELRRVFAEQAAQSGIPSLGQLLSARHSQHDTRVIRIAKALTAVGAIEADRAEAIQADFELALAARQNGPLQLPDVLRVATVRRQLARQQKYGASKSAGKASAPGKAGAAGSGGAIGSVAAAGGLAGRVVLIGMMFPVDGETARGELYLLSYAHTRAGARFTGVMQIRGRWDGDFSHFGLNGPVATDDKGNHYTFDFSGQSHSDLEWPGEIILEPEPPPDIRWLDLTIGGTVRRIPLEATSRPPETTVTPDSHSPGEHYLHGIAAQIFAGLPVFTHSLRRHSPLFRPVLANHLTDGLGDIIAALQSAGALSPLSLVPAQLATLCESLDITNHGITALPARDLPDPWLSLLTYYHRRKPGTATPGAGYAGAAVMLPELDGIRLSILGVHNGEDGTLVHVHASSASAALTPDDDLVLPLLWIRDEGGRWHTTRKSYVNKLPGGEITARMEIFPPLPRGNWIEVLAAGRSAEVRAEIPLTWR